MDGETIVTVRCKSVLSGSSKEQIDMNQTCLETAVKNFRLYHHARSFMVCYLYVELM